LQMATDTEEILSEQHKEGNKTQMLEMQTV
jgi:hypothetical protein